MSMNLIVSVTSASLAALLVRRVGGRKNEEGTTVI